MQCERNNILRVASKQYVCHWLPQEILCLGFGGPLPFVRFWNSHSSPWRRARIPCSIPRILQPSAIEPLLGFRVLVVVYLRRNLVYLHFGAHAALGNLQCPSPVTIHILPPNSPLQRFGLGLVTSFDAVGVLRSLMRCCPNMCYLRFVCPIPLYLLQTPEQMYPRHGHFLPLSPAPC